MLPSYIKLKDYVFRKEEDRETRVTYEDIRSGTILSIQFFFGIFLDNAYTTVLEVGSLDGVPDRLINVRQGKSSMLVFSGNRESRRDLLAMNSISNALGEQPKKLLDMSLVSN